MFYTFDVLTNLNVGFNSGRQFIILILLHVILNTFAMLLYQYQKTFLIINTVILISTVYLAHGMALLSSGREICDKLLLEGEESVCLNDLH